MALIAALLPDPADRRSLRDAVSDHGIAWTASWKELDGAVRGRPVSAAIAAIDAEPRKDGALRVLRFVERYPRTPLVAWGRMDARALLRVGRAGAADVVPAPDATNPDLVRETVAATLADGLRPLLVARLRARASDGALALVRTAAADASTPMRTPDLAERYGVSVSTLERRCRRWGAPPPGRLLLWVRVLRGLAWLLEPARSVESVAGQLGYSSGAAFRRAVEATVGRRPTRLRDAAGVDHALDRFVAEFPAAAPTAV